jgi:ketosteroid isomerase-like protein
VTERDVDFLRGLYELHNSTGREFPDLLERDYLREDVVFVEFPAAPGARTHTGNEAVAALFRNRFESGAMQLDEIEVRPAGDGRVLASFRVHMRGARSGIETSMRIWNLVTFYGGRIARIEEFSEEADALAAAEPDAERG